MKLVMGAGDSRNEAERAAERARRDRIPYEMYCPATVRAARAWASVRAISKASVAASASMKRVVKGFSALGAAMSRPLHEVVEATTKKE